MKRPHKSCKRAWKNQGADGVRKTDADALAAKLRKQCGFISGETERTGVFGHRNIEDRAQGICCGFRWVGYNVPCILCSVSGAVRFGGLDHRLGRSVSDGAYV